ncbi:hemerythrin domain-containing protein [Jongsikchunia kroppenstedtii]|uniref:hemerythrin domain-containing protein n=1 Tax=Jongsikchunia kroppenstedtii TaxID=1121721 RepID=UPI0003A82B24|nr:hemerythrin domain-containing protein [Jongsikchunia kroppenstedtii]
MPDKTDDLTMNGRTTNNRVETRAEAWSRRGRSRGQVDFMMMYAAHDAFDRDLHRLQNATTTLPGSRKITDEMRATWAMFAEQLHIHHHAEDEILWPPIEATAGPADRGVLESMEREHAVLDPLIDAVNAAVSAGDSAALTDGLTTLRRSLSEHMAHEEDAALPLVEKHLGQAGWDNFGKQIRTRVGGLSAAARYLPWLVDGANDDVRASVLAILPLPARVLYRRMWEPKYRKAAHL